MNPKRVRIRKIVQGPENASSAPVEREGWGDERPKVGKRYSLLQYNGKIFRTGIITRVTDEGFETENSLYKFEILKTKRDDIIDETAEPSASASRGIQVTIRCVDGSNFKGSLMATEELNLPHVLEKRLGGFLVLRDNKGKTHLVQPRAIVSLTLVDTAPRQ